MLDDPHISPSRSLPELSQFDFHARLSDLTCPALVAFTAASCGACRHLRRVLQEVHRRHPEWALFEVDAARDQALVNEFEVFHLPTVFLFSDGQFHCQLQAEATPPAIVSATFAALQQSPQEVP